MYGRIFAPGMGLYPPRLALAPRTPAIQQSITGVGVSAPCGAVSTRGAAVFVPGVLELTRAGDIDPGERRFPGGCWSCTCRE